MSHPARAEGLVNIITQECWEQYWTSSGDSTPQSSSYTATYHPSRKLSKLVEPDMRNMAGEVGASSWVMYSCRPLHMDKQRQDVQFEPTYSSSVLIRDVALRICWKQWMIGRCGKRESGISMLIAQYDDDIYIHIYIYIYIYILTKKGYLFKWKERNVAWYQIHSLYQYTYMHLPLFISLSLSLSRYTHTHTHIYCEKKDKYFFKWKEKDVACCQIHPSYLSFSL